MMKGGKYPTTKIMIVLIATLLTVIYVGMPYAHVQAQEVEITAGDFDLIQENINDAREAIHGNETATALAELETAYDELLSLSNETGTATAGQTTVNQTESPSSVDANLTAGDFDLIQENINDAREAIHGNETATALAELENAHDELLSLSNETAG
jgi:5-bromo-4-chloroindolyl phosphate hydrolysis protein